MVARQCWLRQEFCRSFGLFHGFVESVSPSTPHTRYCIHSGCSAGRSSSILRSVIGSGAWPQPARRKLSCPARSHRLAGTLRLARGRPVWDPRGARQPSRLPWP
eukprot:13809099-Alexandrium_andersonii.AAC.1